MNKTSLRLVRLGDSKLELGNTDEDLRGRTVVDAEGEDVGDIAELLIDEGERRVRLLEIASGGSSAQEGRRFLLPIEAIAQVQPYAVRVNEKSERIASAPACERGADDEYFERLYRYYQVRPFWHPAADASEQPWR